MSGMALLAYVWFFVCYGVFWMLGWVMIFCWMSSGCLECLAPPLYGLGFYKSTFIEINKIYNKDFSSNLAHLPSPFFLNPPFRSYPRYPTKVDIVLALLSELLEGEVLKSQSD